MATMVSIFFIELSYDFTVIRAAKKMNPINLTKLLLQFNLSQLYIGLDFSARSV